MVGSYLPKGLLKLLTDVRAPQAAHVSILVRTGRPGETNESGGRVSLHA